MPGTGGGQPSREGHRPRRAASVLLCAVALLGSASCSDRHPSSAAPRGTHVVGLGDSVPAAAGCDCTSFVTLFGDDVERHSGRPNVTDNLAQSGLQTTGLLDQLQERRAGDAVSGADLVTVTIGANDFSAAREQYDGGTCGGADGLDCVRAVLPELRDNLTAVLARIHHLTAGHPVGVRVTNYWNIFEAGEVAADAYGDVFQAQSDRITQEVNGIICAVARHAGDLCIDVYTAFKDASPNGDPTSLLAPDGDHPNQAGHDLIAKTIAAAGFAPFL